MGYVGFVSNEYRSDSGRVKLEKTVFSFDSPRLFCIFEFQTFFRYPLLILSRPRRFGKSLLVSTLENYYQGRKELFRGLAMELLEKDWYVYPVFHVDFNGGNYTNAGELENKLRFYISEWERQYGLSGREKELGLGDRFAEVLRAAHEESGRRAVVLGIQGCRPSPSVRASDGCDQVLSGECFQRFQPARRHQHEHGLRVALRHNPGGVGPLFCGACSTHGSGLPLYGRGDASAVETGIISATG